MASIPASSEPPVRLGLVGVGRWGRIYLKTLAALPGVSTAGLASGNPAAGSLVPAGCPVFSHWHELIEAGGLDGLIVATPPAVHARITRAAIAAGLAVMVEKPLTLDLAEAWALADFARRHDAHVVVDHIHLYAPAFRRLCLMIDDLGPIRAVRTRAGNHGPYRTDTPVLWDWGSHDVAMAVALLGRGPDRATARRLERRAVEGGVGEILLLELGFGGVSCEITLGTLMEKCRRFEVECRDGTLVYDDLAPAKLVLDGQPVPLSAEAPLTAAVTEFADGIRAGRKDRSGLELGVSVVAVLEQLDRDLR